MINGVKTTVIGSYPVNVDNTELMDDYFFQKPVSWNHYIETAVNDMIKTGLDVVSDGQTRDPFVNIFYRKLDGCRIRDRPQIIDKIKYQDPITVSDQQFIKKLIPKDRGIVGLIAGPYTLAKSCVDLFYNDEKQLAFDFADALHNEVKNLEEYVDFISIDEPFFSVEMPGYAQELIKKITHGLSCPIRLHACGDVSRIVSQLIELPVDILSHEFKASPQLFDAFTEYSYTQSICLGSVRSDDTRIESVEEIISHIKKGINIFGDKICQLSPDCGLRLLPRDIAYNKLINLVIAKGEIYG